MISSMELYQIGAMRLLLWSDDDSWVYDDDSVGKAETFLYSSRIAPVNTQFQREGRQMKWSGLVLGSDRKRRDQVLQELRSYVGLPQPLIGFLYLDQTQDMGCGCRHCCEGCTLLWFEAIGEIERVRLRTRSTGGIPELELSIALHSQWRGLNRYHWRWGTLEPKLLGRRTPSTAYSSVIEAQDWPTCQEVFGCDTCHVWEYQDYDSQSYKLDPDYWSALHNCRCNCADHQAGKAASWQSGNVGLNLYPDQMLWGGDTLSVYAFRQLPVTGEIYITSTYKRGVQQQQEQTRIDLSVVNTAIVDAAQGNLLPTDLLYVGDILERQNGVSYPRGFILRNGDILPNVFVPIAASPQYAPGKLGTGPAQVSIVVPGGVESAYQHIYQRM